MVGDVRGLWDQEVKKKKCVKEVRTADCLSIWCQGGVGDFAEQLVGTRVAWGELRRKGR